MKKQSDSRHIPKLDDYELMSHYEFDPRKAKPNRFAGRVKFSHGGARPGSGRKRAPEPVERHTITLYKTHAKFLRSLDANISRAIRKLIAKAK
jgi:hypothetical protein